MEILENTLIQLISRQGSNSDRKNVLLASGEFGYSNDIGRLFIGNGYSNGGDVAGNLFKGSDSDITILSPCVSGDMGFDLDKNKLYRVKQNDGSLFTDWECIGGIYTSIDDHIVINDSNEVSLKPLSSGYISEDAVTGSIIIDGGRIALADTIPFQSVSIDTITFSDGLNAHIGPTDVTNTAVNSLSSTLVIKTNDMSIVYDGLSGNTTRYMRGFTGVTRLSAGDYVFSYATTPTSDLYPIVQTLGIDALQYQPRVIEITNGICRVNVLALSGNTKADANVMLNITY